MPLWNDDSHKGGPSTHAPQIKVSCDVPLVGTRLEIVCTDTLGSPRRAASQKAEPRDSSLNAKYSRWSPSLEQVVTGMNERWIKKETRMTTTVPFSYFLVANDRDLLM